NLYFFVSVVKPCGYNLMCGIIANVYKTTLVLHPTAAAAKSLLKPKRTVKTNDLMVNTGKRRIHFYNLMVSKIIFSYLRNKTTYSLPNFYFVFVIAKRKKFYLELSISIMPDLRRSSEMFINAE